MFSNGYFVFGTRHTGIRQEYPCAEAIPGERYWPLIDHINEHRMEFGLMQEQDRLRFMENFLLGHIEC